jgi:hypothetical protein
MFFKAAQHDLVEGLLPRVIPGGVISLQYPDDTILFLKNDLRMAKHLKWLLTCFEQMSGMRINYHKSDLMAINLPEEEINLFAQVFSCNIGHFLFKYLGV